MADNDVVAAGRPAHPLLHGGTGHLVLEHGPVARQAHGREPACSAGNRATSDLFGRGRGRSEIIEDRTSADLPSGVDAVGDRDTGHRAAEAPSGLPASSGRADGTNPAPAPSASRPCPTTPRPRGAGPGRTRATDPRQLAIRSARGERFVAGSAAPAWRASSDRREERRAVLEPRPPVRTGGGRRRSRLDAPGDSGAQHDQDEQAAKQMAMQKRCARHRRRRCYPAGGRPDGTARAVRSSGPAFKSSCSISASQAGAGDTVPPLVMEDAMARGTFQAYRGDGIASWRAWGCRMTTRSGWPSATRVGRISVMLVAAGSLLLPATATPQGLTGTLIGIVRDAAGRRRRTGAQPVSVPPPSSAGR